MNKTELINAVAKNAGIARKDADKAVNAALEAIVASLKAGDKIQIVGFGAFEVKERAARTARNPRTGEEIKIEAAKAVSFKPGKALKDEVNA
ncbi:MAG: HU family DNA-binding protein [Mailhella sp.]|nr:HU family DNA-binding protein [Mailhella sp.]